jgi:hypothetical protein
LAIEKANLLAATENPAKSGNTKIVVIGHSKNGLPLILGQ